MKICVALVIAAVLAGAVDLWVANGTSANTIYDPIPNHLWNRLNGTLFLRTAPDGKQYGLDELDILYWGRTTNLLTGPSHQRALTTLDEFIHSGGEKLIRDPLKRAWLQRDLWALFDWMSAPWPAAPYAGQRKELQSRLAVVIRRLALTTNEMASLPDNYVLTSKESSPDLPRGIFETNGDWVSLAPDPNAFQEIAPLHDHSFFGGHSAFLVMLHVPGGRPAAISYLQQLRSFEHFWTYVTNTTPEATNSPREILAVNGHLPQFPTNTEWALVRRMVLVDADGNLRSTPVTESIQMRRYLGFSAPDVVMVTNMNGFVVPVQIPPQKFFEFQMNRRHNGELREIGADEKDFLFVHFMGMGFDPFEREMNPPVRDSSSFKQRVLDDCRTCHMGPGIYSVNVYAGFFRERHVEPPQLFEGDPNREIEATINWKREQFNWGLLQGLWSQVN